MTKKNFPTGKVHSGTDAMPAEVNWENHHEQLLEQTLKKEIAFLLGWINNQTKHSMALDHSYIGAYGFLYVCISFQN